MKALGRALVLALFCVCLAPATAHAADELGVSWDGQSWSDQLDGSLFDSKVRWVPGDVRSGSFYVRNQAADGGALQIAVASQDPDRLLRNDEMDIAIRVGARDWVELDATRDSYQLAEEALPSGASEKVRVRARFDPASGNESQRDRLRLGFHVTLTDAGADPGDEPDDPGDHHDRGLPGTGAPALGWLVLLAGITLGIGAGLMRHDRGREADDGATP